MLSGWARRHAPAGEADLMRAAWRRDDVPVVLDRSAQTTAGNAAAVARLARSLGAGELVVVTSRWHARRARALVRAALRGSGHPCVGLEPRRPARTAARASRARLCDRGAGPVAPVAPERGPAADGLTASRGFSSVAHRGRRRRAAGRQPGRAGRPTRGCFSLRSARPRHRPPAAERWSPWPRLRP